MFVKATTGAEAAANHFILSLPISVRKTITTVFTCIKKIIIKKKNY